MHRWSQILSISLPIVLPIFTACSDDGAGAGGESTAALCSNGGDDDGDGFTDCGDQDCWRTSACSDTSNPDGDADASSPDTSDTSDVADTFTFDTSLGDTSMTCDPCGQKGSIKGRVCAPSANVFVNGADVWVEGTGCNGEPFEVRTTSDIDGTYYLLDVPCGVHTLNIEKGSFAATHPVQIAPGQLLDVTGAANKLCFGATSAKIAVLSGTWDNLAGLLDQLGLRYDFFNDAGDQGADGTILDLLSDPQRLKSYKILFANCGGTVGWLPKEHAAVMPNIKDFVLSGGSLYMSDYAWVLGEWAFPDKVTWYNNDDPNSMGTGNSPQVIPSGTKVTATVADGTLASYLGKNTIALEFDQGPQIAPVSVQSGAFAHVVGDIKVAFQLDIKNAPLTLSYVPAQGAGRVIYTNFHNDAQTTSDMLTILHYLVFSL
jgi:hypothetical protein